MRFSVFSTGSSDLQTCSFVTVITKRPTKACGQALLELTNWGAMTSIMVTRVILCKRQLLFTMRLTWSGARMTGSFSIRAVMKLSESASSEDRSESREEDLAITDVRMADRMAGEDTERGETRTSSIITFLDRLSIMF